MPQAFAFGLVGVAALVALVALVATSVLRKGPGRTALVAGLLPLALLPPLAAIALTGFQTSALFSGLALNGAMSGQEVAAACRDQWLTVRVGFGLSALIAVPGLLAGLLRFGPAAPDARELSWRRAAVLCLLPLLGLACAFLLTRELRVGLGVVQAVMADVKEPARTAAVQAYLESAGLGQERGAGGIAAVTERIARALQVAMAGGATAMLVTLGLALTGLILAWRIRSATPFAAVSSVLWLALLLPSALLTFGVFGPPAF